MEVDIKMKKLAIYLHIPFCKQKCKYCDFNSFYINNEEKISEYITSLCKQIEYYADKSSEFEVSSVYFGGGTPSFINEKYIKIVLDIIRDKYNVIPNAEITIEVNPGTVNFEKLKEYKKFGINRLSIGVQTLNDNLLEVIGRVHTASEAKECFYLARNAGFDNISLDIMFGLPNQTLEDVKDTVDEFIKLNPEHVSAYSLKIEEGTAFYKLYSENKLILPSEELERDMYYLLKDRLNKAGYSQYEISNFAKLNYHSKHNTAYWERQDYLGFGISASSCFNEVRFSNTNSFEEYVKNPMENFFEEEILTEDVIKSERVILGLRMLKGVSEECFCKEEWRNALEELINKGLLINIGGMIKLTDKGLDLANQVFVEFI